MKFKFFSENIVPKITIAFLVAFFIMMAIKYNKIILPGAAVGSLVSLYIFYESNRAKKAKRNERRDYINERRQELLDNVLKKNKNSESKNY
jgi:L-asparagine transporter-like permease